MKKTYLCEMCDREAEYQVKRGKYPLYYCDYHYMIHKMYMTAIEGGNHRDSAAKYFLYIDDLFKKMEEVVGEDAVFGELKMIILDEHAFIDRLYFAWLQQQE